MSLMLASMPRTGVIRPPVRVVVAAQTRLAVAIDASVHQQRDTRLKDCRNAPHGTG